MTTKRLPDKPSELLLLALADLEAVEQDKRYSVDMNMWHNPNGKCAVCLAGSVMARTLRVPREAPVSYPLSYFDDRDIGNKCDALEQFRRGHIDEGLYAMGIAQRVSDDIATHFDGWDEYDHYEFDRQEWWDTMTSIVGILQAEGL